MAFTRAQSASNTSTTTSVTATLGSAPTNGDLLVAAVETNTTGTPTITGWTQIGPTVVAGAGGVSMFYKVASGDAAAVTATLAGATAMHLHVFEYAGNLTSGVLDQNASGADSGGSVTSRTSGTTGTTAQADELVYAAVGTTGTNGDTIAWTNAFTAQGETTRLVTADKIVSGIATYETTASWVTARRASGIIATFKAAAVSGWVPQAILM